MSEWLGALFLVAGFLAVIQMTRLVQRSSEVLHVARRSAATITDRSLDDEAKERYLQAAALKLFGMFFILVGSAAAAVLMPLGILFVMDQLGWISLPSVLAVTVSPTFLVLSTAIAAVTLLLGRRKRDSGSRGSRYSATDRALHDLAFRTCLAQIAVADVEDRLYRARLAECHVDRPLFITSMPRAGTTLLLETFARLPEFASHCYRDMPFVLTPCFWNRFSARFRQEGQRRERAHGDGMLIGYDSPEALEEVVWKAFWKQHYLQDRIVPWQAEECNDAEFVAFLRSHFQKIICLRCGDQAATGRYVSKNNLNIARLEALHRLFPECRALIPFRRPLHHAASLLEQHRNFLKIHAEDPFACRYMKAIGHFDFGKNLRPVDFGNWLDRGSPGEATSLAFWLEYWIAAFEHLLDVAGESDYFISYEDLCEKPEVHLTRIASMVDCQDVDSLRASASGIRAVRKRTIDASGVPEELLRRVDQLHRRLLDAAVT